MKAEVMSGCSWRNGDEVERCQGGEVVFDRGSLVERGEERQGLDGRDDEERSEQQHGRAHRGVVGQNRHDEVSVEREVMSCDGVDRPVWYGGGPLTLIEVRTAPGVRRGKGDPFLDQELFLKLGAMYVSLEGDAPLSVDHAMPGDVTMSSLHALPERRTTGARRTCGSGKVGDLTIGGDLTGGDLRHEVVDAVGEGVEIGEHVLRIVWHERALRKGQ